MKPWKYDGETWSAESEHLLSGPDEPFVWRITTRGNGKFYVRDYAGKEHDFYFLETAQGWCRTQDFRIHALSVELFKVGNR